MAAFFGEALARPPRLLFFTGDASCSAGEATAFLALALVDVAFLGDGDFALAGFPPRLEDLAQSDQCYCLVCLVCLSGIHKVAILPD